MSNKRIVLATLAAFIAVAAVLVYFNFDPSSSTASKFFPKCPFLAITGLKCPGCGTQRALHAMLNGNFAAAVSYNALLLVAIPLIALYSIADLVKKRYPTLDKVLNHPATIIALLVIVVAWCIMRNFFNW